MSKFSQSLIVVIAVLLTSTTRCIAADADDLFFIKPYLQLGNHPKLASSEAEAVLWFSKRNNLNWAVDEKPHQATTWKETPEKIKHHQIFSAQEPALEIYSCELSGLKPGEMFDYRIRVDKQEVFSATSMARKSADQPLHLVIFGDCAAGTDAQKKIAYQTYLQKPDLVVIPGDIVYDKGLFSEYLTLFFPVYNADTASPTIGAPLTRSTLVAPVLGNHDIAYDRRTRSTDLDLHPDALPYFFIYSAPTNGPITKPGAPNSVALNGSEAHKEAFLKSTDSFPVISNYSFDYGCSHWTILDGNYYMDWTDKGMREWVRKDLAAAKNAKWKFVSFHQPGFSIDTEHALEQRMRLLSDIFEAEGVDVVWCGHAHNYQRTYPLIFKAVQKNGLPSMNPDGTVDGTFKLDRKFDGNSVTNPTGVIYVVTGGGGARLYGSQDDLAGSPIKFIDKFRGDVHSLSVCDINGDTMTVRQISDEGQPLDEFKVTKNPRKNEHY